MKIAICCRMPKALIAPTSFFSSYLDLIMWSLKNKHEPLFYFIEGANIHLSSDALLFWGKDKQKQPKLFNGSDYDYILWVDSDQVFNGSHLDALIKADKDIICAAIKTTTQDFAVQRNNKRLTELDMKDKTDPMEVDTIGYGFTLIKKGVYEKIPYPWHKPIDYDEFTYSSEDDAFSKKAIDAGFKLYVHPQVRVGHLKTGAI